MSVLALRNLHVGYGGIKAVKGIDARHKNRGPAPRGCDRPSRRRMPEGKMR